ncbi:RYamide receptor [Anthophora retusa]
MTTGVYHDSTRMTSTTTSSPGFNGSYNSTTMPSNESFRMDITGDILWYVYDKFHSETNYLLIILYVPVMALAVTANVLVIAVVFKYHYMRRCRSRGVCFHHHGDEHRQIPGDKEPHSFSPSVQPQKHGYSDRGPLAGRSNHLFSSSESALYGIPSSRCLYSLGFVVILSYTMMGRTLCAKKPPFDCDSVEGSASSQQSFRLVRERRRIAWILLLLAVLFALCWLPYNVLMLLIDLGAVEGKATTDALSYCLFLGHANSALNPMVYCFMTRNFRRSVAEILCHGPHGLTRRRPRHRSVQGTAVIDDVCAGCSAGGTMRRGLLRKRRMLPGCGCGLPISGHHAVLAVRRTATSSSGYDSFYSRHSPHRRCYMLRSLRGRPHNGMEQVQNAKKNQETCYEKNETSQPRANTLVTTDEQRCS